MKGIRNGEVISMKGKIFLQFTASGNVFLILLKRRESDCLIKTKHCDGMNRCKPCFRCSKSYLRSYILATGKHIHRILPSRAWIVFFNAL
uniref:AlNc14C669G12377 protein n=1 Tax=Albugo laibachii Nc14 TaxID=890382 RepID=F0X1R1_9STRA|nr:AlNc14C669G12377 [Albugo laibachii Nc14]|eukprot:CCA27762.1 AlNc14C669G12377 [Albugo laibachii Nc14]